jgi:monoamine oxidase
VNHLTRRGFLRLAAAAPLAAGLAGCGGGDRAPVLVVGGGLCGLVALDRLVKAGRKAVLLEGGTRLGGRIYTVRGDPARSKPTGLRAALEPWVSEGLRAELGAERVGFEDHGVRALLADLGVATTPYRKPKHPMTFEWGGRSYRFDDGRDLPEAVLAGLSDVERRASPLGLLHAFMEGAPAPEAGDARSGIEWLRSRGLTPAGEKFVRAFVPMPLDRMPAPVFFRASAREVKARRSDLVAGGTDQIVEKLASRHSGAITTGVRVVSVRDDGKRVDAVDAQGRKFEGSSAILCLPLGPLRRLDFAGGVPAALAERLDGLEAAHEVKLAREDTDPAFEYSFAERWVSYRLPESGPGGSYVAQVMAWAPNAGPPGLDLSSMGMFGHDFSADPLIGAAYAYSKSASAREGVVVAGRIVVAGADLSDMPGWMEGAVRAAEQAVAALPG